MTLNELQNEINRWSSLSVSDGFLCAHLHEIRPLFYGLTHTELQSKCFDYEDTLLLFANSRPGREIQGGTEPPASVVALLIFFLSLFERAKLFAKIRTVADFLPQGSLRNRAEAIFEYKNITDARNDYIDRFDRIVTLLHDAWVAGPENQHAQCEDLLLEYALDSLLLPRAAGVDLRNSIGTRFHDPAAKRRYPILKKEALQNLFDLDAEALSREHMAVRSRIVESLHSEACDLVPESLVCRVAEELQGEQKPLAQRHNRLPGFIDDQLKQMDAVYQKKKQGARFNFSATHEDNQIYLGTYFPKTVIETWNILSDLLSIPLINSAVGQKDTIRILDIGSGTGATVTGMLLALLSWGRCEVPVEITSLDVNQDALAKQGDILESLRRSLPFEITWHLRQVDLPCDLDAFVSAISAIADEAGVKYDFITCWKCLCEFYNVHFASAQGIIYNALRIASRMLIPYGLFILSDVTTTDNRYEYFAMTLNREANRHDRNPEATMRTILPLPCARNSSSCQEERCYTQRRFVLHHRLARNDETKIAYRVFAPNSFADSIATTFTVHPAYRVNAARPNESCSGGCKGEGTTFFPCGYTGFFQERE